MYLKNKQTNEQQQQQQQKPTANNLPQAQTSLISPLPENYRCRIQDTVGKFIKAVTTIEKDLGKKNQQPPLPATLHSSSSLMSLKKSKQGWQSLMVHRKHSGKELDKIVMKPADLGDDAAFYPQRSM